MRDRTGAAAVFRLATAAGLLGALAFSSPAIGAPLTALAPNTVVSISAAGTTLAVPADNRLNGYDFTGHVLGSAVGSVLASEGVRAAAGQKLWVFGLRWTADPVPLDSNDPTVTQPAQIQAFLVVNGSDVTVPLAQPTAQDGSSTTGYDPGPEFFAASLPAGAPDVALQLAYSGYSSNFSLTHLIREGDQPAALYRNADSWDTFDQTNGEKDLPTPFADQYFNLPNAAMVVKLPAVTLSEFGPDGTNDPAPGGEAWLVPSLEDPLQPSGDVTNALEFDNNVTASDMTLTLPGQSPIHPKTLPGGPDPVQYQTGGGANCPCVFPYQYAFVVPVNMTDATLRITFPPELAWPAFSGDSGMVVHPGPAVFPFSLVTPSSPSPVADAATAPSPIEALNSAGQPIHRSGSSALPYLIGAFLLIIGMGTAGTVMARRRRPGNAVHTEGAAQDDPPPPHPIAPEPPPAAVHDVVEDYDLLDPSDDNPEFQVMGPIRLIGVQEDPALSQVAMEMLAFLVFHPGQRFTAEALATAIGRGRKQDHGASTMRRYANDIRRVVGDDHFPEARRNGYGLVSVNSDVARFDELVRLSSTASDIDGQVRLLTSALALVRGVPFADRPAGSYGWAYTDDDFASLLTNRILSAAAGLAELGLSAGDAQTAASAVRKGLLVRTTDIELHQLGLRAAAESTPSRLSQAWSDLSQRFKTEEEPIPEVLHETYRRLLNPVADR